MYKPPENMNRVKAMRSKFEKSDENGILIKNENTNRNFSSLTNRTPGKLVVSKSADDTNSSKLVKAIATNTNVNNAEISSRLLLTRQLSDPVQKINIKRTPAFRLDKNSMSTQDNLPQCSSRSKNVCSRVKIFDKRLKENNCDKIENICDNNNVSNYDEINNLNSKHLVVKDLSPVEPGCVMLLRDKFSNSSSKFYCFKSFYSSVILMKFLLL